MTHNIIAIVVHIVQKNVQKIYEKTKEFYHVSKNNLGFTVDLEPRVPASACTDKEGDIPHICVSTHVFYCLRSILGVSPKEFHVFNLLSEFRGDLKGMESEESWVAEGGKIFSPAIYTSSEKAFIPPNNFYRIL